MEHLSFENLPTAIALLTKEVSQLKELLTQQGKSNSNQVKEEIFDINGASIFLGLSLPTIYSMVSKNTIPFMKRSKRLYFSSVELSQYLKEGSNKSSREIQNRRNDFLSNKKG